MDLHGPPTLLTSSEQETFHCFKQLKLYFTVIHFNYLSLSHWQAHWLVSCLLILHWHLHIKQEVRSDHIVVTSLQITRLWSITEDTDRYQERPGPKSHLTIKAKKDTDNAVLLLNKSNRNKQVSTWVVEKHWRSEHKQTQTDSSVLSRRHTDTESTH